MTGTKIHEPSPHDPAADNALLRRARVVLSEPIGLLDYRIPSSLVDDVSVGVPVCVPLGKRQTSAYVAEVADGPGPDGITLRDIERIDRERPRLPPNLIRLILFAADYYGVTPGDVLAAALPAGARRATKRYRITDDGRAAIDAPRTRAADRQLLELAARFGRGFTVAAVERDLETTRRSGRARLKRLTDRGWLTLVTRSLGPRTATAFERAEGADPESLSPRQKAARALFELIPTEGSILAAELAKIDRGAYGKLKTLEKAGLVRRIGLAQRLQPHAFDEIDDVPPVPTPDQAIAIDAIGAAVDAERFQTFLLHGVTGSGKTEVYLRVIEQALARGRTALILVPEIALTPQLGARFRARFGDQVATFHSALTVAERRDEWERVAEGKARIGLGARSALFLPLSKIGVVIVDEEHETSFKQDESPRYHARDLAVVRGQHENAAVVLGSATPSLESKANADSDRYALVTLPIRVRSRPMPQVESVDLAKAARVGEGIFTERLATAVEETLRADRQVILFLNRRGFAPYIFCRDCGHAFRCSDCEVSLTLHRRRDALICHYCGFQTSAPDECPSCHSHKVDSFGLGTERVEGEIAQLFGNVPTARLDRDTVRTRADLERALERFGRGEAKILVGTQMVAKGHDFPGVTLVGVIAADAGLNFPDFRAAERTFQLLTQVAGRAGRGDDPGHVVIQAYETEHYALQAAMKHDYEAFARQEIASRRELNYPPFSHLVLLRFESPGEAAALDAAKSVAERMRASARDCGVHVLGPAPAPLSRLRGLFRMQILLKGKQRGSLRKVVHEAMSRPPRNVRQIVDIDPLNML